MDGYTLQCPVCTGYTDIPDKKWCPNNLRKNNPLNSYYTNNYKQTSSIDKYKQSGTPYINTQASKFENIPSSRHNVNGIQHCQNCPSSEFYFPVSQFEQTPLWLEVYFKAPQYLDCKLHWDMFPLMDLERFNDLLRMLFRKKWKDTVSKYEMYRLMLNKQLDYRIRKINKL